MFKRLLLLLLFLTFTAGCGDETPHEMDIDNTGLPGIVLPLTYLNAYEIVEEEWWYAGMPYSPECITRKEGIRLFLFGWDDFERSCGGEAYSKHLAENHESHRAVLGCTGYNGVLELQYITLDAGMTKIQKHKTMMHEAIHVLGSCAEDNSDGMHSDPYRWKIVLGKAKARVECSRDTSWQTEGRTEPLCLFGEMP